MTIIPSHRGVYPSLANYGPHYLGLSFFKQIIKRWFRWFGFRIIRRPFPKDFQKYLNVVSAWLLRKYYILVFQNKCHEFVLKLHILYFQSYINPDTHMLADHLCKLFVFVFRRRITWNNFCFFAPKYLNAYRMYMFSFKA